MRDIEVMGKQILDCALRVHEALGPGLLEDAYETCLRHELAKQDLKVERQHAVPLEYDGLRLDVGYRLGLLVEGCIVVEVKAVQQLKPLHFAQLLSYLKLGRYQLGYLLNFNVAHMNQGVRRVVNGL